MDRIGLICLDAWDPKGWTYVPGARPGGQGPETMGERGEQLSGKGRTMEERAGTMEEREHVQFWDHLLIILRLCLNHSGISVG